MKKVFYFFVAFMIASAMSIAQTSYDSTGIRKETVNQTPMGFDDHTHGNYLGLLGLLGLYGLHRNRKNNKTVVDKRIV